MSKPMSLKHYILKIIQNGILRTVPIRGDFIQHNTFLFHHLLLRKNRVKKQIFENIKCSAQIGLQKRGMKASVFLGGIGIEVCPNRFKAIEDLGGISPLSPFKQEMFDKMGQAKFGHLFIPGTRFHQNTCMCNRGVYLLIYQPDSVREPEHFKIHIQLYEKEGVQIAWTPSKYF